MLVICFKCLVPRELKRYSDKMCKSCYAKERKMELIRTCIDCGDKKKVHNLKSTKMLRCQACKIKHNAKDRQIDKTHTLTCPRCNETRVVKYMKKKRESDLCHACSNAVRQRPKKPKVIKPKVAKKTKPKPRSVSPEAIAKAREVNRKHKLAIAQKKDDLILDEAKERAMIDEWLLKNEPKRVGFEVERVAPSFVVVRSSMSGVFC